jgi:hypothetical protein
VGYSTQKELIVLVAALVKRVNNLKTCFGALDLNQEGIEQVIEVIFVHLLDFVNICDLGKLTCTLFCFGDFLECSYARVR